MGMTNFTEVNEGRGKKFRNSC